MNFENNQNSLLTFRVGPVLCCAPSLPVRSIITPPKLTHPPGSDRAQPGIFRHGSSIVKVIDLRQKFAIDKSERTAPGHLIICIIAEQAYAFWVDQIIDVFDFPTAGWGSLPPAIPRGIFTRTLLLEKKIHLYSEFEKLINIDELDYLKHYIKQLSLQKHGEISTTADYIKSSLDVQNQDVKNQDVINQNVINRDATNQDVINRDTSNQTSIDQEAKNQANVNQENISLANKNLQFDQNQSLKETELSQAIKISNSELNTESLKSSKPDTTTTTAAGLQKVSALRSSLTQTSSNKAQNTLDNTNKTPKESTNHSSNSVNKSTTSNKLNDKKLLESKFKQSNTAVTATEQSTYSNSSTDNNEPSAFAGIILFALIFLIATGFILYLFLLPSPRIAITPLNETPMGNFATNDNSKNMDKTTRQTAVENKVNPPDTATIILNSVAETTEKTLTTQGDINPEKDSVFQAQVDIPLYRADILEEDNEITITIHSPVRIEKDPNTETLSALPLSELQAVEASESIADKIAPVEMPVQSKAAEFEVQVERLPQSTRQQTPETIKADPVTKNMVNKQIIREVVHTVRKGDTLWAIAKKYVNDPFLYPELARLSNIKNPHRIYPGNRVRIRFIKNQ